MHHKRTRQSGEQRGTTVKASEHDEGASNSSAQVNLHVGPRCSQLPELRARPHGI